MNAESIEDAKAALRAKARAARSALGEAARAEAAAEAARHFLAGVPLREDEIVAVYWPIHEELDVKPLLGQLVDRGQPVCLPVVRGEDQPLDMRLWEAGTPLYPAGFGTLAPADDAPRVAPHIVVVPLLGFDAAGTRLGYGGGYYDRTFAAVETAPRIIGLAFAAQELAHIPRETHDRPLDAVVTENGVRHFAAAPA